MRKIVLLLLIIFVTVLDSLQSQGGFLKRYEIVGYDTPYFTTILASDTCYWAFGIIWDTSRPYLGGTAVFQFDLEGNLLKQKELISKTQFFGFNNDMYVSNNKLYTSILNPYSTSSIIVYDILNDTFQIAATVGNLLPEGDFLSVNNLHFDIDGNCYLANTVSSATTTDSYNQIQIVKFNNNFEIDWSTILGNTKIDEIPFSITTDSIGNVYVGAQRLKLNYFQGDANYSRSIIYKLSSSGKLENECIADSLSGGIYDLVVDWQGNYICASEVLLPYHPQRPFAYPAYQKIDLGGKLVYRQYFEEASRKEEFYSYFAKIKKVGNNYCTLGAVGIPDEDIQPLFTESKAIFVKFNENGDLIWKRIYNTAFGVESTKLYDFDLTEDHGFIMAGLGAIGTDVGLNWRSILIKVDSFGCLVPGCQLTNNSDPKIKLIGLKIFPNPASDYLALYNATINKVLIHIFDLNGKEFSEFICLSNETSIIDISKYSVGSYFLQAFDDGKIIWSEIFVKK